MAMGNDREYVHKIQAGDFDGHSDGGLVRFFRGRALQGETWGVLAGDCAEVDAAASALRARGYDPDALYPTPLEIAEASEERYRDSDDPAAAQIAYDAAVAGAARRMSAKVRAVRRGVPGPVGAARSPGGRR